MNSAGQSGTEVSLALALDPVCDGFIEFDARLEGEDGSLMAADILPGHQMHGCVGPHPERTPEEQD